MSFLPPASSLPSSPPTTGDALIYARLFVTASILLMLSLYATTIQASDSERIDTAVREARQVASEGPFLPQWESLDYGEGPTGTATGHLSEKKNKAFTAQDIRFTARGDTLYAIVLDWPEGNELAIKSLGSDGGVPITGVTLLGSDAPIAWEQTDSSLNVRLPMQERKPCEHAFVLKIEQ